MQAVPNEKGIEGVSRPHSVMVRRGHDFITFKCVTCGLHSAVHRSVYPGDFSGRTMYGNWVAIDMFRRIKCSTMMMRKALA